MRPGDRAAVAVSGGADSVALLLLLEELRPELGVVLSVAHVNHKLRASESDEDERFVANLAARLRLDLDAVAAPIQQGASTAGGAHGKSGIEAAARELRYQFFSDLGRRGRVTKIATAHTLDDQAETVLLRIFRGTGIRGLAGIHPRLQLGGASAPATQKQNKGAKTNHSNKDEAAKHAPDPPDAPGSTPAEVIRPLLTFRRRELRDYLRARNETWREDSSNDDPRFLRNRVRQRLLPLIAEGFGAPALQHMAELAEIARAEEEYWCGDSEAGSKASESGVAIAVNDLLASPLAAQRRHVRAWLEANVQEVSISFALIEEILDLARGPIGKKCELPGGAIARTVRRGSNELALECASANQPKYEYVLRVPGKVAIPELRMRIEAQVTNVESVPEPERNALLDPERAGATLTIRNWRAGDRYRPAHTAREKKVKELLADRHATGAKKKLWPVAVNQEGSLVWMQGFPAPASLQPRTTKAIWIREFTSKP